MSALDSNWRWIVLIVIVAILFYGRLLPSFVLVLALAGGGAYLLYRGWQVWSGAAGSRVTYWRGRRIELPAERRDGATQPRTAGAALLYLLPGCVLVLVAMTMLLR
jgi:predicted membrane metal-binding protein